MADLANSGGVAADSRWVFVNPNVPGNAQHDAWSGAIAVQNGL